MRLVIHSTYLTLEYLYWRKHNFGSKFQGKEDEIQISIPVDTQIFGMSRNLHAQVSHNGVILCFLKQYGSIEMGSHIKNEFSALEYLKTNSFYNIPRICFFDEPNLILATTYFTNTVAFQYVRNLTPTDPNWQKRINFILTLVRLLKDFHDLDSSKFNYEKYNSSQVLKFDNSINNSRYLDDTYFLQKNWYFTSLIHFDPCLVNILVGQNEEIKIIDWELATIGDPIWDIAIFIISVCYTLSDQNFFTNRSPTRFENVKTVIKKVCSKYFYSDDYKCKLKVYMRLLTNKYDDANEQNCFNTIDSIID